MEGMSLERVENIEEKISNLVVQKVTLEQDFQLKNTEIEKTITEFNHRLDVQSRKTQDMREISGITQEIIEHHTQELAIASATIHKLSATLEKVQAREISRDVALLGMIKVIKGLERKLGGSQTGNLPT